MNKFNEVQMKEALAIATSHNENDHINEWCTICTARDILSDSVMEILITRELLYEAWGIIANASNGDWSKETKEWQKAAKRWRNKFNL